MTLEQMKAETGLSNKKIAQLAGVSHGAVSAVVNRRSGRDGIRLSQAARARVVAAVVSAWRRRRRKRVRVVPAGDARHCPACGQAYRERRDGVIVCGCAGAERYPARSVAPATTRNPEALRQAMLSLGAQ